MDPWSHTLALITGGRPAPMVRWPAAQIRRVLCRDEPDEDDPERAPTEADREVLQLLERQPMRAPAIAAALGVALPTVHVRMHRLRERGWAHGDNGLWRRRSSPAAALPYGDPDSKPVR